MFSSFRNLYSAVTVKRSPAVALIIVILACVSCRPNWGELDVRAIEFVQAAIESPLSDEKLNTLSQSGRYRSIIDDQAIKLSIVYLRARNTQTKNLDYTVSKSEQVSVNRQIVTVAVKEGGLYGLHQLGKKYFINVYFVKQDSGLWSITRLSINRKA